ncbi:MAG: SDR family NAD(P)-dependent oxidoreductase [Myxococcota bacterium]
MNPGLEAYDLGGRTAVITGAASGMGQASARLLSAAGAAVILGDLKEGVLESLAAELLEAGAEVEWARCDVTEPGEVDALVARAEARGGVDVMANLAGVIHDSLVVDTTEADLDWVLSVNVKGVYFGCQAAARAMSARGRGSIVNMASSGAFTPVSELSTYSISKAGVVALTRVLAAEVGRSGVRVNAIAPGYIEGGMTYRRVRHADGSIDEEAMEKTRERVRRGNALPRLGTPEDVAHAVLYLASDASRYLTGQVLHANGGAYMP